MARNRTVKLKTGVLVINGKGLEGVLKSDEVQSALDRVAEEVQSHCGDGYEVGSAEDKVLKTRAIATVYPATPEAKQDNLNNNTLLKAAGSTKLE